jgi:tetratricopeptide (TPR) repeat protein
VAGQRRSLGFFLSSIDRIRESFCSETEINLLSFYANDPSSTPPSIRLLAPHAWNSCFHLSIDKFALSVAQVLKSSRIVSRIHDLVPPDSHHLNAAVGWMELGNPAEATEELEKISPKMRIHPDVLAVRWQVYYKAGKFQVCYDLAKALTEIDPVNSVGWIDLSIALYKLGKTQEAWNTLSEQAGRFPDQHEVFYSLACYAAQLGKIGDAESCLKKAIELAADGDGIRLAAVDDPDLAPLWTPGKTK